MSRVFDGSQTGANETYIHTSTSAAINTLQALTLAAWIYPTSAATEGVIAWKDGAAAQGPLLLNLLREILSGKYWAPPAEVPRLQSNLPLNTWTPFSHDF